MAVNLAPRQVSLQVTERRVQKNACVKGRNRRQLEAGEVALEVENVPRGEEAQHAGEDLLFAPVKQLRLLFEDLPCELKEMSSPHKSTLATSLAIPAKSGKGPIGPWA